MQEKLVFVVEDDPMISRLISRMLKANGASFIIAHNLEDALSLFRANKDNITFVLLDGSLTERKFGDPLPGDPETLPLAEEIARTEDFYGLVYPMSSMPNYTEKLMQVLGSKGIFLGEGCTKTEAILEIIKLLIKAK